MDMKATANRLKKEFIASFPIVFSSFFAVFKIELVYYEIFFKLKFFNVSECETKIQFYLSICMLGEGCKFNKFGLKVFRKNIIIYRALV